MSMDVRISVAMISRLLLLFCASVNILSSPAIPLYQCKSNDDACVTNAVRAAFPIVIEANPEIGAETLDPMFFTEIEGNLSILKFKLFNTTITGFKTCEIQKAKYNEEQETLQVDMLCAGFSLKGWYDINGRLIVLPVEGNGDFLLDTKKYRLLVDLELKTVTGKDGKSYKSIKTFKVDPEALEGVVYDFRNLFNGQKDLSDAVHKFANENWKEVANEVQSPVFKAYVRKIVKNANKYLKTVPVDEYIVQ